MNLNYSTYHTFEKNGNYYLFDNARFYNCVIDKRIHEALTNNKSYLLSDKERRIFKDFSDHNIFFVDEQPKQYLRPKYNMVIISMALSHRCNLKCKYCFADAGENFKGVQRDFDEKSINLTIDFLLNDYYFSQYDYYRINLVSGGEPLLNKPLFRMFIETAFKCFKKANKHLYIWFATNGTLLTEEDLLFISKYNVGYGISIDGDKLANDRLRIYSNSLGTYDDIVNNIKNIQESKAVPQKLKELWGLMVYTRQNEELLNNIIHLQKLGFSTVQMRFVRSNDETLCLNITDINDRVLAFIDIIFEQAISGDDSLLRLISNDNDYIGKIIKRILLQNSTEVRCGAGSYMFSFTTDGSIYPCDCFVGNSDYKMGDIYNGITHHHFKRFEDLSVYQRKKCNICWAKYVCGGDCYHNSYLKNGDILIPDDNYCELILQIIESIISNTNRLQSMNKEIYNAFCNFLKIRERMSKK